MSFTNHSIRDSKAFFSFSLISSIALSAFFHSEVAIKILIVFIA
jgi:hypothetical protein